MITEQPTLTPLAKDILEITKPLSLHEKLVRVFKQIDYVAKKGKNTGQGYDYQRAADVANAVRDKLFEQGVLIYAREKAVEVKHMPSAKGGVITEVKLEVEYYITDGVEGVIQPAFGMARDNSDKALWKAKTGAMKYLLRGLGLIPDEKDDPEHGEDESVEYEESFLEPDARLPQSRWRALETAAAQNGHSSMAITAYLNTYHAVQWSDLKNRDFDRAFQWASSRPITQPDLQQTVERSVGMAKAQRAPKSQPNAPEKCSTCGSRMVKAGVSKKTGKPYPAFCSSEACPTKFRKSVPDPMDQTAQFGGYEDFPTPVEE